MVQLKCQAILENPVSGHKIMRKKQRLLTFVSFLTIKEDAQLIFYPSVKIFSGSNGSTDRQQIGPFCRLGNNNPSTLVR